MENKDVLRDSLSHHSCDCCKCKCLGGFYVFLTITFSVIH